MTAGAGDASPELRPGPSRDLKTLESALNAVINGCESADGQVTDQRAAYVPTVSLEKILEVYELGGSVVFVDTREPEEYLEGHIPGAIHLPLRDIKANKLPEELHKADFVVS